MGLTLQDHHICLLMMSDLLLYVVTFDDVPVSWIQISVIVLSLLFLKLKKMSFNEVCCCFGWENAFLLSLTIPHQPFSMLIDEQMRKGSSMS